MPSGKADESLEALRARLNSGQRERLQERLSSPPNVLGQGVIPRGAAPRSRPLSAAERGIWYLEQLLPHSQRYTIPLAFELIGELDLDAFRTALETVVGRHPVLRSTFHEQDGVPLARVAEGSGVSFTVTDVRDIERWEVLRRYAAEPFQLAAGPLVRVDILRTAARERYVLLLCVHHLVADASSLQVILDELSACYRAGRRGLVPELPAPRLDYADYAAWQNRQPSETAVAFWRQELLGASFSLDLPTVAPRPPVQRGVGAEIHHRFPPGLADACREVACRQSATVFMVQLTCLAALLSRYAGQQDLVIGVPVSGRTKVELERLVGLLVNTVPIRIRLDGNPSLCGLLERVRAACLRSFAFHDLPLDLVVRELAPERDPGQMPMFQVLADAQEPPFLDLDGLRSRHLPVDTGTAKLDLAFSFQRGGVLVTYDRDLFDPPSVGRLVSHLTALLGEAVQAPDAPLSRIVLASPAERRWIHAELNATTVPLGERTVPSLIAGQATRDPEAIAVECGAFRQTYEALNRRANQLAHLLRRYGVGLETPVAVCMERCADIPGVLLGILRTGGFYVPLDPEHPAERNADIMTDTAAKVLLVHRGFAGRQIPAGVLELIWEDLLVQLTEQPALAPDGQPRPDNLAYVMYTSGSTGRPKGVQITHRGVVRLVHDDNYFNGGPGQVFLLLAPLSFDAATFELWAPLCTGARLAVHPPGPITAKGIEQSLSRHGVSVLWLTTGLFHAIADAKPAALSGLRQLIVGGDVISPAHVRKVLTATGITVSNGYGPTEGTTFSLVKREITVHETGRPIPIGRPIAGTQAYVVDEWLQLLPPGVPGELMIGGLGLARGYHGHPELTAARFLPNPFGPGRLYRTGDMARLRADGQVEFLGRVDRQVKIRGHRVEPGEAEFRLTAHPAVSRVVVTVREDRSGQRHLVAYLTLESGWVAPGRDELEDFCREGLPGYMVPSAYVIIDRFPLDHNGKVDLAALPEPARPRSAGSRLPRDTVEITIAEIWAELLDVSELRADDDFFDLGGHSLLAMVLIDRIHDRLGVELPVRAVMERRTIAGLAAAVSGERRATTTARGVAEGGRLILLTGGTGMTGRFLAAELRRRGMRVRVLARPGSRSRARGLGDDVAVGDLADPASLRAALPGVTGIVHAACTFTRPEIDVAALRELLAGWREGPFVFVSSIDVYGPPTATTKTERSTLVEGYSRYADGKIRCERLVVEAADRARDRTFAVLRPPYVWGPDPYCLWQLQQTAAAPLDRAVGARRAVTVPADRGHAWVDARELAWVAAECLIRPPNAPLNVVNDHFSWYDLAVTVARLTGSDIHVVRGDPVDAVFAGDFRFGTEQAERLLGFRPHYHWTDTLAEAAELADIARRGQ